jgi:SAM-dependent methyltransferase
VNLHSSLGKAVRKVSDSLRVGHSREGAMNDDSYGALPDVYEWLIPDAKLTPQGAVAAVEDLVHALSANTRVLDCACGTGQLAVGLADLGMNVVAADASPGMIRRTQELAAEHGVSMQTLHARWDELPDHLDASSFDLIFCVGNSLGHAEGASGRSAALAAMARLLKPGGRLVLTSRAWEHVRANGSRLDIRDRLIRRNGRDALLMYRWEIEQQWEQEHHLEITVAQLESDGTVRSRSERLSIWPFRYEELVEQLHSVDLKVETTTRTANFDGYTLVAGK